METIYLIVAMGLIIGLMLIGTPVAFALGSAASVMVLLFASAPHLEQFVQVAFSMGTSPNLLVSPLFIIMAELLSQGGVASDIFTVLNDKFKKFRSGLAISATIGSTVFAALCGSSAATTAAIGRVSITEMIKKGYRADFTVGVVMAGGTLGIMIPPSLPFVTFGIITETSIAKLLMAGLIPGLMISAMLCIYIFFRVKLNPKLAEGNPIPRELILDTRAEELIKRDESRPLTRAMKMQDSTVLRMFLPALLILLVLGSMYMGWATPTECAGIGAIGALLIVYVLGRLKKDIFTGSLISAARTSAMVLFLVINGFGLTYIVSYLGIAQSIANAIVASGTNKWVVLIMVYILWLVLGCLLDPGSMIVLTIPFLLGTLTQLGFDKIWIGVVSTLLVEVGMITPPVGMNLFVCKGITGLPFGTLMRGGLPFLAVFGIALVLLTVFPQISLWLPNNM